MVFQKGPSLHAQLLCCTHLPGEAKAVTHTHPAATTERTCLGRAEPPNHRAALKTTFREHRKLSLMEGEALELFHPGSSTSITRWECCTPGEPLAELSARGGSGATAGNSPAVHFSFSSPVLLPGINA